MDKLEKFITENHTNLEEDLPTDLWAKIAGELDKENTLSKPIQSPKIVRMISITKVWQLAAGFAALLVFGLGLQFYYFQSQTQASIENLVPELAEAENFYFSQISNTKTILKSYNLKEVGIETGLKEIDNLDTAYQELKKEFYSSGNREAIISAMIQNLQLRADLLNQKLQIIRQAEKAKKGQVSL
jgi:hypothetical protein